MNLVARIDGLLAACLSPFLVIEKVLEEVLKVQSSDAVKLPRAVIVVTIGTIVVGMGIATNFHCQRDLSTNITSTRENPPLGCDMSLTI